MYCDNGGCDSRETDLLVMRGHDENFRRRADTRADVRALVRIDDGAIDSREPIMEGDIRDTSLWNEEQDRHTLRVVAADRRFLYAQRAVDG
jgi:hypothetical protein